MLFSSGEGEHLEVRMRARMELFAKIRRDARVEGLSIRGLAKRYQIGRDTVRQALSDPVPPPRKTPERSWPRLDPFKLAIDDILIEDTTAPRKQRHTASRILARLIEEHGAEKLSYSNVRDYVRVRRAQIDVEAGRRVEVFVPQEHAPGAEAEVDFGEVWVVLNESVAAAYDKPRGLSGDVESLRMCCPLVPLMPKTRG